jgi:hypothetical protein
MNTLCISLGSEAFIVIEHYLDITTKKSARLGEGRGYRVQGVMPAPAAWQNVDSRVQEDLYPGRCSATGECYINPALDYLL